MQEGGSLCDTFVQLSVRFQAITMNIGVKLPQATRNANSSLDCLLALVNPDSVSQQMLAVIFLTSVDSLLCPTSMFSLAPSADCVLPWTSISSRLFSSALLCQLTSLCLFSDLPSLVHFQSRGKSYPRAFVWVSRQNRQRDRLSGANTNGNELLRIVSHLI